jgi:hypothetical protein
MRGHRAEEWRTGLEATLLWLRQCHERRGVVHGAGGARRGWVGGVGVMCG